MNEQKLDSMKCTSCVYKQDFVINSTITEEGDVLPIPCPSCKAGELVIILNDEEKSISKAITQEDLRLGAIADEEAQSKRDNEARQMEQLRSRSLEIKGKLSSRTASMEEMMEYMTLTREI
jgi:hypothetical protein